MCGIAGIVDKRGRLSRDRLSSLAESMAEVQRHRGPDSGGVWVSPDGKCAFAHRRLSIIELSDAGHQPMIGDDGAALSFNGEIYNFRELRETLQQQGAVFRSQSDTEVLLHALRLWGRDALNKIDGMFAFAHYDQANQALLLARDLFGEKPLYVMENEDVLAFSSELHALTLLPDFDDAIELDTLAGLFCYQYVPAPDSIYRSVSKLPPGSSLQLRIGGASRVQSYAAFRTSNLRSSGRTLDDLADELEDILTRSVRQRMISDVPLGAFLSGGVDSSTIAALATKKLGRSLKTFSIGFAGDANSEHFEAAEIARQLGTDHDDRVIEVYGVDLGKRIASALDEPNADSSCVPTYLVSGLAREQVTVALSGDGGDELFGGYNRYFNTMDEFERHAQGDRSLDWWSLGKVYLGNRILVFPEEAIAQTMGRAPAKFMQRLTESRRLLELDERPLLSVLRESDAATYLPGDVLAKVDRMSMLHSLEVRAPLLGREVADFAGRLAVDDCYAAGQGKLVLKKVASRFLPEAWLRRPKRGFGLPVELWDRNALMPELRRILLTSECRLAEWIAPDILARYVETLEGEFSPYRAWTLFITEHWLRTHKGRPA